MKVIHLSRNFRHQIAFTAGLDSATGDAVAVLDADLKPCARSWLTSSIGTPFADGRSGSWSCPSLVEPCS